MGKMAVILSAMIWMLTSCGSNPQALHAMLGR